MSWERSSSTSGCGGSTSEGPRCLMTALVWISRSQYTLGGWRGNEESREKGGGAPCPSPQPQSQAPTTGAPKPINKDSLSGSEESCLLFIFRGCSPNLQCWGSWDAGGTGHRWTCGCHRDFDLEQKSRRHQVRSTGRWLQRCVHWGAVHRALLLTDLTGPALVGTC